MRPLPIEKILAKGFFARMSSCVRLTTSNMGEEDLYSEAADSRCFQ